MGRRGRATKGFPSERIAKSTNHPMTPALLAWGMSRDFWDERYARDELVYGQAANDFLTHVADRFPREGQAIDLGAGEGRNALFLAERGLDVLAVDQSKVGMEKAQRIATQRGLQLRTLAADLNDFDVEPASIDVVSSIFVHLPQGLRSGLHARVQRWLKPGGFFVLEAYAPDQIARTTGGPKDPALLAPLQTLLDELAPLKIEHALATVRTVVEGSFHSGEASVVQVVARKN